MTLLTSSTLWFLLLIPLVVLMYILKQKFNEEKVSSLYLWDIVLKDVEVNTPWQKLKKNLLLLLQILIIILLIFAAANPFINYNGTGMNNLIVVIDNSGSMSALYENNTRLDEAKEKAISLIKSSPKGSAISVISMESEPNILISNSSNKSEVLRIVDNIEAKNATGNINESLSLVKSIAKQYDNYKAVFYSDSDVELKDINGELISLSSKGDNVSLDHISSNVNEGIIKILVRLTNRSEIDLEREVSLYDSENTLLDINTIDIKAGETKTIFFNIENENKKWVYAEITEKDSLIEDNKIYYVIEQPETKKVILVTDKNLFIEKAISPINNVELYKTSDINNIDENYDLYIFDGKLPEKLPEQGSLLIINPDKDIGLFKIGKELEGGKVEIKDHRISEYIHKANFSVSKMKDVKLPYWAQEIFSVKGYTVAFAGEYKGKKIGVLTFDLHNSDFPLSAEFPIFMNNIVKEFLGSSFSDRINYNCGEEVKINPIEDIKKLYINKPEGKKENLDTVYPIKPFSSTSKPGIYSLIQSNDEENYENLFSVNFPSESESNINVEIEKKKSNAIDLKSISKIGLSIQPILILLALFILLIEWRVYINR
ncbi:BatA and WFA domain-containing protein [Clostridium sediminicola]|uniref:vWA domain-containing protein n=1 Tax=Clostridium sediminicola TaxID=3114879 RepID=UPI0031F2690C